MKFHSKPITEHQQVPLADDGQWEQLVAHWQQRRTPTATPADGTNRCYVVCVGDGRQGPVQSEARMAEVLALVRAQGDTVVGHEHLVRRTPDPRTWLGKGAASAAAERATELGATMLVVDSELSPSQTRNLEDATGLSVCDREAVILNVFLRHAKTRKARIQVEIAQLEYLRPRIRGLGLDMDQQAGGMMNARGPGETASELLARQLDGRLAQLRKAFARLARAGRVQRETRRDCATITLVGYTNAGKTSLMNALTNAGLSARDMPFETLDTTSRALSRHGGDVVLSDTVGFIRRLPVRLLESFESTLAEIREATVIAIVVDLSDPERQMHLQTTEAMIKKLGAADTPRFYVFNKLDQVPQAPSQSALAQLCGDHPWALVSSHDAEAVSQLQHGLLRRVRSAQGQRRGRVFVPYEATELTQLAYAHCRIIETKATDKGLVLTLEGPAAIVRRLRAAKRVR